MEGGPLSYLKGCFPTGHFVPANNRNDLNNVELLPFSEHLIEE
jgi:hypothetical protein